MAVETSFLKGAIVDMQKVFKMNYVAADKGRSLT